ncbi:MAG: acetyl-CoA C-acetyltransferase [Gammaproteobacteria bacterium]|nr:MAG: acetyl-CoA C-acetyltransferase [Gammaproteobacteria bacterium]
MAEAFIYDHLRSPRGRGRPDGSLHTVTPVALASQVLGALRQRSGFDTALVDDVVLGCVAPIGEQGANVARVAALGAGYAESVPGQQVHRFCASGLEAVNNAAAQVMCGQSELVIGGGVESMSRVPMGSDGGAWPSDPAVAFPLHFVPQGISADLIATLDGYSREQLDAYALESQRRAATAWREGWFSRSVTPIRDVLGEVLLDRDEYLRPQATAADLAALKPAFETPGQQYGFDAVAWQRYPGVEAIRHVHTAGNSSGIVDGAAAVLVGSRKVARALGLKPRARIRAFASVGSEPTIMLTGPAAAARKVLRRARMTPADIDLWELNEAFASVVLRFMRELELDPARVNVAGGAIAMGHPLGATGAMILGIVLDELERRELGTALVTLCIGAGMGTATVIERL